MGLLRFGITMRHPDWPLRSLLLFGRMDLRGHMTAVRIHLISWIRPRLPVESPDLPVREECGYISAEVWDARSFCYDLATESHIFGLPVCSRLVVWESPGLPVREECSYICAEVGDARLFCSDLVTESYHVVPAVRVELVLRDLRRLLELLLWTDFSCSRIFRTRWWRFIMSSGTGSPAKKRVVRTPVVLEPLPGIFRGFDLTLQSDCLYDLDKDITDVIGLRMTQPAVAVMKVMSIPNNSVRVVIPDNNVGTNVFHEIIIHDMADADAPEVPVSELGCLQLDWPQAVLPYMGRYQKDLESLRHECRERFGSVQLGLCTHCGKFIRGDLGRHVAHFHLDLAQLWRCPVT